MARVKQRESERTKDISICVLRSKKVFNVTKTVTDDKGNSSNEDNIYFVDNGKPQKNKVHINDAFNHRKNYARINGVQIVKRAFKEA